MASGLVPPHMQREDWQSPSMNVLNGGYGNDDSDDEDRYATVEGFQHAKGPTSSSSEISRSISIKRSEYPGSSRVVHRIYHVVIAGSMMDLANKKARIYPMWRSPSDTKLYQVRPEGSAPGAERVGNIQSALIHKVTVKSIKNTFPMAIGWKVVTGDKQTWGREYAPESGKRFLVVASKEDHIRATEGEPVHFAHNSLFSDDAQKFSGCTLGDAELNEVVPGSRVYAVPVGSALYKVLENNQGKRGVEFDLTKEQSIGDGIRVVHIGHKDYLKAKACLEKKIHTKMARTDFKKFGFKLARTDGKWLSPIPGEDNRDSAYIKTLLNTKATASMRVEISYQLDH